MSTYHLIISCPDRYGIVATVSQFIAKHHGFIVEADQHSDAQTGWFFMRYVLDLTDINSSPAQFMSELQTFAGSEGMEYQLIDKSRLPRVLLLASKEAHCFEDLLFRWQTAELPCEIIGVASNHDTLQERTAWYKLPFYHLPIENNDKAAHLSALTSKIDELQPDVIILARYMQVLPSALCEKYMGKMINIHHSFLPSFVGAKPYHQAYQRGVKLIGATAHYVTKDLDAGPIIEQDVARINHRLNVEDYKRLGRDVERQVLAKALRAHLADRVMVHEGRTIIF